MTELLTSILLMALQLATVCLLFAMLFLHAMERWWLRAATLALGVGAIVLPILSVSAMLGHPDPWPSGGRYEEFGWDVNESDGAIYLFVAAEGDPVPRQFKLPVDLKVALRLQKARENRSAYHRIDIQIDPGRIETGPNSNPVTQPDQRWLGSVAHHHIQGRLPGRHALHRGQPDHLRHGGRHSVCHQRHHRRGGL